MREFEFVNKILNDHFLSQEGDGRVMHEDKDCDHNAPQRVKIVLTSPINAVALYRFDLDDYDFLPFFGRVKGLKRFCDYILLVECNDQLTVILIEMKRSKNDGKYRSQLDASRLFMEYVIANAERVKEENGFSDFQSDSIKFRRVKILADPTYNKLTTKPRNKALKDGRDSYIVLPLGSLFNPKWVI